MGIKNRLYEDYLKKDRLLDYRRVLEAFRDAGYEMVGTLGLHNMVKIGGV